MKKSRLLLFTISSSLLTLFLAALFASAEPGWWSARNVLDTNSPPQDFAAINQGQLKHMVTQAAAELDAALPQFGGAGSAVSNLVHGFTDQSNYLPVNLGQLKAVAAPFYDRLIAIGYSTNYPWDTSTNAPADYAMANIGQAKNLFSLDFVAIYDSMVPSTWRTDYGEVFQNGLGDTVLPTTAYQVWQSIQPPDPQNPPGDGLDTIPNWPAGSENPFYYGWKDDCKNEWFDVAGDGAPGVWTIMTWIFTVPAGESRRIYLNVWSWEEYVYWREPSAICNDEVEWKIQWGGGLIEGAFSDWEQPWENPFESGAIAGYIAAGSAPQQVVITLRARNVYDDLFPSGATVVLVGDPLSLDLRVDSNNDGTITDDDDSIEDDPELPGKILAANPLGDYSSGAPSFPAVADRPFTPMIVVLKGLTELSDEDRGETMIYFAYSASDPAVVLTNQTPQGEVYGPGPGAMRLWTVDSDTARNPDSVEDGGHYVPAFKGIAFADLFPAGATSVTLYIEGVAAASAETEGIIYADIYKPSGATHGTPWSATSHSGQWGWWEWITDQVRVTILKVKFAVTEWNPVIQDSANHFIRILNNPPDHFSTSLPRLNAGDTFTLDAKVKVTTNPGCPSTIADELAAQWKARIFQNVIAHSGHSVRWTQDLKTYSISPMPGLDAVDDEESFGSCGQEVSLSVADTPGDSLRPLWNPPSGKPNNPLTQITRDTTFVTWLVAQHNETEEIVVLPGLRGDILPCGMTFQAETSRNFIIMEG